jgi:hypothetical protein
LVSVYWALRTARTTAPLHEDYTRNRDEIICVSSFERHFWIILLTSALLSDLICIGVLRSFDFMLHVQGFRVFNGASFLQLNLVIVTSRKWSLQHAGRLTSLPAIVLISPEAVRLPVTASFACPNARLTAPVRGQSQRCVSGYYSPDVATL